MNNCILPDFGRKVARDVGAPVGQPGKDEWQDRSPSRKNGTHNAIHAV
jgi:hypothetical protein